MCSPALPFRFLSNVGNTTLVAIYDDFPKLSIAIVTAHLAMRDIGVHKMIESMSLSEKAYPGRSKSSTYTDRRHSKSCMLQKSSLYGGRTEGYSPQQSSKHMFSRHSHDGAWKSFYSSAKQCIMGSFTTRKPEMTSLLFNIKHVKRDPDSNPVTRTLIHNTRNYQKK